MKPDTFDFIEKHNLHDTIREKVRSHFNSTSDVDLKPGVCYFCWSFFFYWIIYHIAQVIHSSTTLQVVQLMKIDSKRAVSLLIQHRELITPFEVVSQLLAAKDDSRYFLHLYLHSLFVANPDAGREFHDMQVYLEIIYYKFTWNFPIF